MITCIIHLLQNYLYFSRSNGHLHKTLSWNSLFFSRPSDHLHKTPSWNSLFFSRSSNHLHIHEIDFSLIFKVWSSFTLGRENCHEIACFFSSFGDHLHKTCGQKTMPQSLVGLSPPKDLILLDFEWGYRRKIIWIYLFFGPFGKKSRSNGANWKAMKGMDQSHAKGQIVEMGMQRETSLQPRRVYCSNHIYLTWHNLETRTGTKKPKGPKKKKSIAVLKLASLAPQSALHHIYGPQTDLVLAEP